MKKNPTILVTCGEMSGDLHASLLVRELRKRLPSARILAFGGNKVAEAGAEMLYHTNDYSSVIGFSGVLSNLPSLVKLERGLKRALATDVDLFIPVDYPGLNLRLASRAKQLGVPVLYFISPQVWAWGRGRVQKMAQVVDYMAVILPFEEQIYRDQGIPVEFVGHPFVEDDVLPRPTEQGERSGVGLLPGSRSSEVRRILPMLLQTARHIQRNKPNERFTVGMSPSVPKALYEKIVSRAGIDVSLAANALDVMARSNLLLVASGTATLQGALVETPLIVVYRVSPLNYFIASRLVKVDHIGLVNIILGEEICPEFVQVGAKPALIAEEAITLLDDEAARGAMIARFGQLRDMLAGPGGCRRVAELSEQLLNAS